MKWPATGDQLREAGYQYTHGATCKGCGASVIFVQTPKGKAMPLVRLQENLLPSLSGLWQPHFVDCPKAKDFKRPKKAL